MTIFGRFSNYFIILRDKNYVLQRIMFSDRYSNMKLRRFKYCRFSFNKHIEINRFLVEYLNV